MPRLTPQRERHRRWTLSIVVLAAVLSGCSTLDRIAAGTAAKLVCSGHFVAHRPVCDIIDEDLNSIAFPNSLLVRGLDIKERYWGQIVATKGSAKRRAVYYPGYGCTLLSDADAAPAAVARALAVRSPLPDASRRWPDGAFVEPDLSPPRSLASALNAEFAPSDAAPRSSVRAVVVVKGGRVIAERYADGFGAETPQLGWSMAKSVLGMLIGQRIADGALSLDQDHLFQEWASDSRAGITVRDLLFMRDGLDSREGYLPFVPGSVPHMLTLEDDVSAVARRAAADRPHGSHWAYRSATTNLLSRVLRNAFADDAAYWVYPRERLFGPIGAATAVFETDVAGNFVGSSYLYASARDWARLGLLLLRDGAWEGRQVLPRGWRDFVSTLPDEYRRSDPSAYGAQVWLRGDPRETQLRVRLCNLPDDGIYFSGHWGQIIAILPQDDLVIVRLGWTTRASRWDQCKFLESIVDAVRAVDGRAPPSGA